MTFEAHITIEPVFDERLEQLKALVNPHRFRVAELLMKKRVQDEPEVSRHDTFMTAHGGEYSEIRDRVISCARAVSAAGYKVIRYKIEAIMIDSRFDDDTLEILK